MQSSCQTNEGVRKKNIPGRNIQTAFFPCIDQILRGKRYCGKVPAGIRAFSICTPVSFNNNEMKIHPLSATFADKCEGYWHKAEEAFNEQHKPFSPKGRKPFGEFDRLLIGTEGGTISETCFNVKRIGKHGICQITKGSGQKVDHWGFCSRSCAFANGEDLGRYRIYEEADFVYYKDPPTGSELNDGSTHTCICIYIYIYIYIYTSIGNWKY